MALKVKSDEVVPTRVGESTVVTAGVGARPLLAITPLGADWMTAALPGELERLFTIYVMELPGTGRSTGRDDAASVDAVVAAAADVAARLESTPVLFGHSMNGALVLATATSAPCLGVIAVTPPSALPPDPGLPAAYWESHAEPERRRRATELVAAYEATTDDRERSVLQDQFTRLRRWYDLTFDPTDLDALMVLDQGWVASVFETGKAWDWPKTLTRIQSPVLLALGDYDFIAPPSAWSSDVLPPAATVHHFEKSGHTPYVEEPEEFVQVTEQWLLANVV